MERNSLAELKNYTTVHQRGEKGSFTERGVASEEQYKRPNGEKACFPMRATN